MKRTALLLVAILVLSLLALSSCDLVAKIPVIGDLINKDCAHIDEDLNHNCDKCDEKISECETPDGGHNCPICGEKLTDCAAAEGSHSCATCGNVVTECADENKDHNCDICGKALSECVQPEGGHNCLVCDKKFSDCQDANNDHKCDTCADTLSECADEDKDYSCDLCGGEVIPDTHERVNYELNISDLATGKSDTDIISGKFTIAAGTEIRGRGKTFEGVKYTQSVKLGDGSIVVSVPGTGKLSFILHNGSGGAATQTVTVTAPDGTTQDFEFPGAPDGSPLVRITVDVTEGEWTISHGGKGGTRDIFYLNLSCIVEKSEENGFKLISAGTVDYLVGQKLDLSGIVLNATYANGKTDPLPLENVTVDTSLVNLGASGTYPITISYKEYTPITVNINVYLPTDVKLDFDGTAQGSQTSAGNGTYVNKSFKEVYSVGDTLDLTGLYVSVTGTLGEGVTKTFANVSGYTVSEADLSTAGKKDLTVSYIFGTESVSATTSIHVVDTAPSIVDDNYQVKVDASYTGTIGAVEGGYNMFSTIQQALDFLASSEAGKRKIMIIEAGLYTEKLEITIPNLHIKGVGADKVTIEWDSIYGQNDASGFSQITDSTQTVAVRDSATGVTIEGVTISNYWNSQERMDAAGLGIERGLALLVQADRFIMRDSKLLGIQDTLELFTGRQYFENVFISGYTDFVFGTNNTTLFKNCTIHVIDTEKDDKGTAGYITAFKGSNKGANDAITYGAIFYQCDFTADEGVNAGNTAIGRTWGAYAAVAVIECELGGHLSVAGYSSNKNERYISMNGILPTDETVQFVEYGNTGAGALTEAVAGMKMLTAEEAALYIDIATIFGKTNHGVSWLDSWNPNSTEIKVDTRVYYYFNGASSASGTSYTYSGTLEGSTGTFGDMTIDATSGKAAARASDTQVNAGTKFTFNVKAGHTVTVSTYPGYHGYSLNGTAADADVYSVDFASDTTVEIVADAQCYLYSIIISETASD